MLTKIHRVFKVRHIPSGKFMGQGASGHLTYEGHIWPSKRGANLALSHVARIIAGSPWRYEQQPDDGPHWVDNVDDCEVVMYELVEVREAKI
jgi:hypothetical protein